MIGFELKIHRQIKHKIKKWRLGNSMNIVGFFDLLKLNFGSLHSE
jgi:hypothetical protein